MELVAQIGILLAFDGKIESIVTYAERLLVGNKLVLCMCKCKITKPPDPNAFSVTCPHLLTFKSATVFAILDIFCV
jgi:hypothetical protein